VTVDTATPIAAGHMKASGDDIRFVGIMPNVKAVGFGPFLPYYIESGINTTTTKIWLRFLTMGQGLDEPIAMIYGNPDATAESSGGAVFDFFEGFDGPTTRFAVSCGTGNESLSNGVMTYSWTDSGVWIADTTGHEPQIYPHPEGLTAARCFVAV